MRIAHIVSDPQQTLSLDGTATLPPGAVRRFRLTVVEGPKAGLTWESSSDRCSIGFHPSNDLVVDDATVSRFHCEVRIADDGARVRDLDSRNGTVVDGVRVSRRVPARRARCIKLGRVGLRFEFSAESNRLPVSAGNAFGKLVGASVAMRTAFALLERAAQSDVTVLLEGETGTGKGVAAEAIHRASTRARRAVRRRRLRRDPAEPARVRAVRPREGLVHRRGRAARRRVRGGVGRHHLPRRDRRAAAGPPAEAAARARVRRSIRRVGGNTHGEDRRARGRGDQPRPARRGQRRPLPLRLSTSASRSSR